MRKTRVFVPVVCALLLLAGCGKAPEPEACSATLFAMDTVMELTVYGDENLLDQAEEEITRLEEALSVTKEDSEIFALNQDQTGRVSGDTAELLRKALTLCGRTGGALDLSVYPVVRAWGFTTGDYRVPEAQELADLLAQVDYKQITLREDGIVTLAPGMQIDLGSVAKGYAGDRILALWKEQGVTSAMLNLGGNVQALGAKPDGSPWRVGITDPAGEGYAGGLSVVGKAVITSGGYERYFTSEGQTYHHIIDPATGCPADSGLLSVTVVGEEGLVCDGLSTALFVLGLEEGTQLWRESQDFEAVFLTEEGIVITQGLADSFSPLGAYENAEVTVLSRG